MAKLLDCAAVSSLEIIDPALTVSATITGGYVTQGAKQVPALLATWSTISNPYVTGIQFEYGPSDMSSGAKQSDALKAALAWSTTSSIVAGGTYTRRYRAIGVGANTYGPWTAAANTTVPAAPPIVAGDFDTTGPAAPGAVTLSQSTVIMSDGTTATFMTADWPDNVDADLDGYKIQWSQDGVAQGFYPVTSSADTIRTKAGSSYIATVFAVDKLGNPSVTGSASGALVAGADTTGPGDLTGASATALARRVVWSWIRPADTDYSHAQIYRNTTGTGPSGGTTPTFPQIFGSFWPDVNVAAGTTYYYWGRTVDRTGNVGSGGWVYLGSAAPGYVTILGGDVLFNDPDLATLYGTAGALLGSGSGAYANNLTGLNPTEGAKFGTMATNAGTSGVLTPIGSYSTVVGNSISKAGGTHGAEQGGGVGRAQKGSAYISSSLLSAVAGSGWETRLSLDDDATSYTLATCKYVALFVATGAGAATGGIDLYVNGVAVGIQFMSGLTLASRMTLAYDGAFVSTYIDGVRFHNYSVAAGQTLWPKVLDYYNSVGSPAPSAIIDIQHGAWSEAARIEGIWNVARSAQYGPADLVTASGNAGGLIGGGNLLYVTLPSYANAGAAVTGGVLAGQQFYNTTTGKPETVQPGVTGAFAKSFASGVGGATATSTTYTSSGNVVLELTASLDGGKLNANGTYNGTFTLREVNSGGTTSHGPYPFSVSSNGLEAPIGQWATDGGGITNETVTGVRTGVVTYYVDLAYVSGATYAAGAVINCVLKITPIV